MLLAWSVLAPAAVAAPGRPALAQDRLPAVATFSILGDLVRNVGGDRIAPGNYPPAGSRMGGVCAWPYSMSLDEVETFIQDE